MKPTAHEISLAFNQQNTRKVWNSRPNTINGETVHFTSTTGSIALVYEVEAGRWQVRFNKFQASWGDYVKAIARALYIVLSTLKSAGLPFEAPESPEGVEIVTTASADATVYVRWPGAMPVPNPALPNQPFDGLLPVTVDPAFMRTYPEYAAQIEAIMPELRAADPFANEGDALHTDG